jgi:hypothetical protein
LSSNEELFTIEKFFPITKYAYSGQPARVNHPALNVLDDWPLRVGPARNFRLDIAVNKTSRHFHKPLESLENTVGIQDALKKPLNEFRLAPSVSFNLLRGWHQPAVGNSFIRRHDNLSFLFARCSLRTAGWFKSLDSSPQQKMSYIKLLSAVANRIKNFKCATFRLN